MLSQLYTGAAAIVYAYRSVFSHDIQALKKYCVPVCVVVRVWGGAVGEGVLLTLDDVGAHLCGCVVCRGEVGKDMQCILSW